MPVGVYRIVLGKVIVAPWLGCLFFFVYIFYVGNSRTNIGSTFSSKSDEESYHLHDLILLKPALSQERQIR